MSKKSAPKKKESFDEDIKLKAVVIAESFSKQFRPITLQTPRILLPLVNTPVIEYILEFLTNSGVDEIFIFCCAHAAQVSEYIKVSKWKESHHGISINIIQGKNAQSFGDALRQIGDLNKIREDFILMSGDVITSLDIREIFKKHKMDRKKTPEILMTSIFKQHEPKGLLYRGEKNIWITHDPVSGRLLHYENDRRELKFPLNHFQTYPEIQVRSDLADCFIDICAPEVLEIFRDNYVEAREKFIMEDILADEVMNRQMNCHILVNDYSSRIHTLRAYEQISRDIINRLVYPIVPDTYFETKYNHTRENNYIHEETKLDRSCMLQKNNVVGLCVVGSSFLVNMSVIGNNVKIGKNVKIFNSFIFNNAIIEDDVEIHSSIICGGARLLKGSKISRGCIISYNVIVGPGITIPSDTRLTCDEEENDMDEIQLQEIDLGEEGYGSKYILPDSERKLKLWNTLGASREELKSDDPFLGEFYFVEEVVESDQEEEPLESEVIARIKTAITEDLEFQTAKLEIQSVKFSRNALFSEISKAILTGMFHVALLEEKSFEDEKLPVIQKAILSKFKSILLNKKWKSLLLEFLKDSEQDKDHVLDGIFEFYKEERSELSIFAFLVNLIYGADILTAPEVLHWFSKLEKSSKKDDQAIYESCTSTIDSLKDQVEEEEEEEDEEDVEEDEEEVTPKMENDVSEELDLEEHDEVEFSQSSERTETEDDANDD